MMSSVFFIFAAFFCNTAAHAEEETVRNNQASVAVWLNDDGSDLVWRGLFQSPTAATAEFYDYEYDAFTSNGFVLKYLETPAHITLSWTENRVLWQTSILQSGSTNELAGLLLYSEAYDVRSREIRNPNIQILLEDTVRFFEVLAEQDDRATGGAPDRRLRVYAERVNTALAPWMWPGRDVVEQLLVGAGHRVWYPASFRYVREYDQRVTLYDGTETTARLVIKDSRNADGKWTTTQRLFFLPLSTNVDLQQLAQELSRFLPSYGLGAEHMSLNDPDPFFYTQGRLTQP